jgi:hypothetical protein
VLLSLTCIGLLSAGDEAPSVAAAETSGQQGAPLPTGSGRLGSGKLVHAVLDVNQDTHQVRLQLTPVVALASAATPPRASASPLTGLERLGSAMLNLSGMFSGLTGRQGRRPHASEAGVRGALQTTAAATDVIPGKQPAVQPQLLNLTREGHCTVLHHARRIPNRKGHCQSICSQPNTPTYSGCADALTLSCRT